MKTIKKVVLLLFATAFSLVLFIGCASQTNSVFAGTYSYYGDYSADSLEIKVKFKSAYAIAEGTEFYSKNTISELKEQIDKQKQKGYVLETKPYGERYLLADKNVNGKTYHYLLTYHGEINSKYHYRFIFPMNEIPISNTDKDYGYWLFPYHLFGDAGYDQIWDRDYECFSIETNHVYASEYGIDEFYKFYNLVSEYTVKREENMLSLQTQQRDKKIAIDIRFDETESGTTVTYYDSVYLN